MTNSDVMHRFIFVLDSGTMFFKRREELEKDGSSFVLYSFTSEKDLLIEWSRFIHDQDPDIFIGYNIFGFDWNYIHQRCLLHRIEDEFCRNLSRTDKFDRMFQSRQLSSTAYGDNTMTFYNPTGRLNIDLYLHIKKEFKLDSYKLDNVAKHFINQQKHIVYRSCRILYPGLCSCCRFNGSFEGFYFNYGNVQHIKDSFRVCVAKRSTDTMFFSNILSCISSEIFCSWKNNYRQAYRIPRRFCYVT